METILSFSDIEICRISKLSRYAYKYNEIRVYFSGSKIKKIGF